MKSVNYSGMPALAVLLLIGSAWPYPDLPFCQAQYFDGNQFGSALITSTYRAVEVVATLRVDSLWNTYDLMTGHRYFQKLEVISVAKVDTSIFANDGERWMNATASQFSYDTSLFKRTFLDSTSGQWPGVAQGDTLRNAFVLQEDYPDNNRCFWSIIVGTCAFFKQDAPPISIRDALAIFNDYLDKNNLYRGYRPPAGPLKLGPLFLFGPGDCGWSLRAYSDANAWFIEHYVGDADCPAGCTASTTTLYKVANGGDVFVVGSKCGPFGCAAGVVNRKPATRTPVSPATRSAGPDAYDLHGRRIAVPAASVNNRAPAGVYFVGKPGSGLVKILVAF
jgi:hypothetical protein